jgi:very-short-patch-repair endonuclease
MLVAGPDIRDRGICANLIESEHFGKHRSIRELEREYGWANGRLSLWCKKHGIAVRSRIDQVKISGFTPEAVAKRSGANHYLWGKTSADSDICANSSRRMKLKNPMATIPVAEHRARSIADTFREKLTPQEYYLLGIFGQIATAQHPIGRFNLDIAFEKFKVAIELDGKGHTGRKARARDLKRDSLIVAQGWTILRIYNAAAQRPAKLIRVLKQYIPDLQTVCPLPDEPVRTGPEYRVLVRDANNLPGIKV